MKPERWQQIDQILEAAIERDRDEWAAFLDQECAGDDELRREVDSLLRAHEQAGSFIEKLPPEAAEELLPEHQSESLIGKQVGSYGIERLLGSGGMGEVYLATDKMGRQVALKLLAHHHQQDKRHVARFAQEAQTVLTLNHPNIVTIYDIGEIDGTYYIASELIEGETLRSRLKQPETHLPDVLEIAIQVTNALVSAHEKGIVHRDIKPENVMLRSDGYVKVLDFGIAKLTEEFAHASSTEAPTRLKVETAEGVVIGTAAYMSPEQAKGTKVDARTDLWSLGAVIYEMVTGHLPFAGETPTETISLILQKGPAPLSRYTHEAPAELERIVTKALTKDREQRYQTAKDLLIDLRNLKRKLEVDAEIDRTVPLQFRAATSTSSGQSTPATASGSTHVSSAEYLTKEIKRHKKGVAVVLAVFSIAVIGLAFGLYKIFSHKQRFDLQTGKITRLTSNGRVGSASISPDGKYVAYTALDDLGQSSLWVKYVATSSNVQIVPPAGPDVLFGQSTFSPDGNYIYYLSTEKGRVPGVLYQVPVLGGTSKKLLEDVSRISFSPDGKRFAFERRYASGGEDAVMVVNADGSGEQKLAVRKHPDYFLPGTAWSPDGQTIACPIGGFTGGYYRSITVIKVSDGTQKILTSRRWNDVERPAWLPDGSGVIATAQEKVGDQSQLWQISYPEGEARTLTNDLSDYHLVSLTADASALVTVVSDTTSNIWLVPNGEWNNGRQLTSSKTNGILSLAFLHDGRILYQSSASGNSDLWIMDPDGRNQKQLTDDVAIERSASATPDGRYIVFDSLRSGAPQVWRMNIDGSNAKLLTDSRGFIPSISPDGKWVVYTMFGPEGFNIWKISIDGGEPVQITHKYSAASTISPDGKLIAYYYLDQRTATTKIALLPFEGGEPSKLFDISQPFTSGFNNPVRWTHDGRAFTYIVNRAGVSNIWIQPIDGSPARQLTDFKADRIFSFDWSHDGKWLALSRGPEQRDVVLMSDFKISPR
ncbi:MAG TPA: protein kinase [Pyrinomonadaceae bacterium]|nr:protein kinase [Pyrinomonadaceae bacterium]